MFYFSSFGKWWSNLNSHNLTLLRKWYRSYENEWFGTQFSKYDMPNNVEVHGFVLWRQCVDVCLVLYPTITKSIWVL